jgi:ferredoxin--NADP+ reductase
MLGARLRCTAPTRIALYTLDVLLPLSFGQDASWNPAGAVSLPDVPFDERHFVLPNDRARVLSVDGEPLPGVYAVGWIKRGPIGILGTNKRDAEESVSCLADDLRSGALQQPPNAGREQIDALLAERQPDLVTVDGWRAIDGRELAPAATTVACA